jgi:SAM-dependent methyltransferase
MTDSLLDRVTCARCPGKVDPRALIITCERCNQVYPRVGPIPALLPRPDAHVDLWRQQLVFVAVHGQYTLDGLQSEAAADGLLDDTRARLRALAEGARDQALELAQVLVPALGGTLPSPQDVKLPRGADNPIQYVHYLYRDWGWDDGKHPENQVSLDTLRRVMGDAPLGRTLVIGAGGCRLAYDLHREHGATETAVLDIDPFTLVIAEAVVRGASVKLTESTANIQEASRVARAWTLAAHGGPLDDKAFHCFFANGLAPPFTDHTFDTIVTPWFIDQVPPDLPAFLGTIARLLRPKGRWLNSGPLLYPADAPIGRRFSRDEIFELAARAGLRISKWFGESRPYLVSPLNGRGKVEWVLSFEALTSS